MKKSTFSHTPRKQIWKNTGGNRTLLLLGALLEESHLWGSTVGNEFQKSEELYWSTPLLGKCLEIRKKIAMKAQKHTREEIIEILSHMVFNTPNDYELGKKIRDFVKQLQEEEEGVK